MTAADRARFSRRRISAALLLAPALAGVLSVTAWADDDSLIRAALDNRIADVRALLADGANPDAHDRILNTPLIFAARDGRTDSAAHALGSRVSARAPSPSARLASILGPVVRPRLP